MEGNFSDSSGLDNRNASDSASGSSWLWINLPYFIRELCEIANISTTGNNMFSQRVSENILQAFWQRQEELIRFQGLMKSLCDITGVSSDGEDIFSQSLVDRIEEHVRQDLMLLKDIRSNLYERQPSWNENRGVENIETQPQSQLEHVFCSEIAPNDNMGVPYVNSEVADVNVFAAPSQVISLGTSSVNIAVHSSSENISSPPAQDQDCLSPTFYENTSTDPASSGNDSPTPPVLLPNWAFEAHQSESSSIGEFDQPLSSANETGVVSGSEGNSMLDGTIQTPQLPSTSRQFSNRRHFQTTSNAIGTTKDTERTKQKEKIQDYHDDRLAPPVLSPNVSEEGNQSAPPAQREFGQSTNENHVMMGIMLNEINQNSRFPTTSRQLAKIQKESINFKTASNLPSTSAASIKKNKRRKGRVLRTKIHAIDGCREGSYYCICESSFNAMKNLKNHIKRYNSVWKFKCKMCLEKFYILSQLKAHLIKRHGIKKPLKDFAIGCTLCGIEFETRLKFRRHTKAVHDKISKGTRVPRQLVLPPKNQTPSSPPVVKIELGDDE